MAEKPVEEIKLLKRLKPKLISILNASADSFLQHADSRFLLSDQTYKQINALHDPSKKVRDILDHVIQRGPEAAQELLQLLKDKDLQDEFPKLRFLHDMQVNKLPTEVEREAEKRKQASEFEETVPAKQNGSLLVTEKQLMTVARGIGKNWREIGIDALNISSVKLQQIEMDNPNHVDRVFAMLNYWRNRRNQHATPAKLHELLSVGESALPPENIDFLLETAEPDQHGD